MAQQTMYDGLANSPITTITNSLSATDTIIYVLDDTKIPTPPNLLVIGGNLQSAETVKLIEKEGNMLTVERAFQGTAIPWTAGATIARNFTEYDYRVFKENIEDLEKNKATKTEVQENTNKIGILSNLPTTNKDDLVGAITEVNASLSGHTADLVTDSGGVHGLKVEEGSFTPTIYGYTVEGNPTGTLNGKYSICGNILSFSVNIQLSNKGGMDGNLMIGGLPVTPKLNGVEGVIFSAFRNWTKPADLIQLSGHVDRTLNSILIRYIKEGSYVPITCSNILDDFIITINGQYQI